MSPTLGGNFFSPEPPGMPRVEYYLAIKKEILSFAATWMDLENIMLNEISQTECMRSLICGI